VYVSRQRSDDQDPLEPLVAVLGDASGWRNAREFACALGLTPRHRGTGGKVTMGAINKRGDPYVRMLLVSAARAAANGPNGPEWVRRFTQRRPANVAVVTLAKELARTAWALLAHQREFDRQWVSKPPRAATA
jgi:transposase